MVVTSEVFRQVGSRDDRAADFGYGELTYAVLS
jgi:hypothetical protein